MPNTPASQEATGVASTRERVQDATREAHIRALLVALNGWLREPQDGTKRREVSKLMRKYQASAGRLFQVSNFPALTRNRSEWAYLERDNP